MTKLSPKSQTHLYTPVVLRAIRELSKWEIFCPKCGLTINLMKSLKANNARIGSLSLDDVAYLMVTFCPNDFSQMGLKPTRSNIRGLLFLIWQVIGDYFKRQQK